MAHCHPSRKEILDRNEPGASARWFFTQQHGLNRIFEILGDHNLQ